MGMKPCVCNQHQHMAQAWDPGKKNNEEKSNETGGQETTEREREREAGRENERERG